MSSVLRLGALCLSVCVTAEAQAGYVIETLAGNGSTGCEGDGGPPLDARIESWGIAIEADGNLLISDQRCLTIRRIDLDANVITSIAGDGTCGFADGPLLEAKFQPGSHAAFAIDAENERVYITDSGGSICEDENRRVRMVDLVAGTVTTLAGDGTAGTDGDGGPAVDARVRSPHGAGYRDGKVYVADGARVRMIDLETGIITTVAGTGSSGFSGDGGPATSAQIRGAHHATADSQGNVYIADRHNHRVRKVDTSGIIITFAGTGDTEFNEDGRPATEVNLHEPWSVAVDVWDNVYVIDGEGHTLDKINRQGILTRLIGDGTRGFTPDGNDARGGAVDGPDGVTVDAAGNVYFMDSRRRRLRRLVRTNTAPTADAGPDQTVDAGDPVALDGMGSRDPEGDSLTFVWTQVAGPAITLSDSADPQPTFTAPPLRSTLTFSLVVTDDEGLSSPPDTVTIEVLGPPVLSDLAQREGATAIAPGSVVGESVVTFEGRIDGALEEDVRLEVEVRPVGTAFTGTPTATSPDTAPGTVASVDHPALADGRWRWRARAVDTAGYESEWAAFPEDEPHFIVDTTAPAVTVSAPAAGVLVPAASATNIAWTTDDENPDVVSLAFSTDDGGTWSPIAGPIADASPYAWTVPALDAPEVRVRVVARDAAGHEGTGISEVFAIVPSRVRAEAATPTVPVAGTVEVTLRIEDATNAPLSTERVVGVTVSEPAIVTATSLGDASGVGTDSVTGTTAPDGTATVTITSETAGTVTVTPAAPGTPGPHVPDSVVFEPGGVAALMVTGMPSPIDAGQSGTVTVTAVDAFGNRVDDYAGTVTLTSSDPTAVLPAPRVLEAADAGEVVLPVTLRTAGMQWVEAGDGTRTARQSDIEVRPLGPDHLRLDVIDPVAFACESAAIALQVVDVYGNAAGGIGGDGIAVAVSVSSDDGTAEVVGTSLAGAEPPGASVSGRTGADGSAEVAVALDAAGSLEVTWSSAELAGAPGSPSTVDFQTGPADATRSTLSASGTQVTAFTGEIEIVVSPRDACDLALPPGREVVLTASTGELSDVTDQGDGTYRSVFTSQTCPATARIDATVDGVALDDAVEIEVVCLEVDEGSPVVLEPGSETVAACASGGEYATVIVVPREDEDTPLPPGREVTVSGAFVVTGPVEAFTDPETGWPAYAVSVGSDRCDEAPREVTVRVDGVVLSTRPEITFTCLPVADDGIAFSAPSVAPADGVTPAEVGVTAVDTCGNPAFSRAVALEIADGSLGAWVTDPDPPLTRDAPGEATDGTARFEIRSTRAGTTSVVALVEDASRSSGEAQVRFVVPAGALNIAWTTAVREAVPGQVVRMVAGLSVSDGYEGDLVALEVSPQGRGLRVLTGDRTIDRLSPGETREVEVLGQVLPGTPTAAGWVEVAFRGVDEESDATAASEPLEIRVRGEFEEAGCECAGAGGGGATALLLLLLLGGAWRRRFVRRG